MKTVRYITLIFLQIVVCGCVVNYVPVVNDYEEQLVVEGLITDQPGINTIKVSWSEQIWDRQFPRPLKGCIVSISDNLGNTHELTEGTSWGTYITDSATFCGVVGREYTLHIKTTKEPQNFSYKSRPIKMLPVPAVDSVYYEKEVFRSTNIPIDGCNIFLDTHDPSNTCKFYRWEYLETWEIGIPFDFPNKRCWASQKSDVLNIKNASFLPEAKVSRFPVVSIQDPDDRLTIKYSILVKQFSLNEEEYNYWAGLKNTMVQTGGLYDIIPATIPNNIYCVEDPNRDVLGYFCVSAVSSKRLFIEDEFSGINDTYSDCYSDTIFTSRPDTLPDVNAGIAWIVVDNSKENPPSVIVTYDMGCIDCRTRGTNIKPDFWDQDK